MSDPIIFADNLYTLGTPTATTTDSGAEFDVANINDYRTYTFWKAGVAVSNLIVIDTGSSNTADTLAIIGHNLGTVAGNVSVVSSATGAFAGEETTRLGVFVPTDDFALLKTFGSASDRYWAILIQFASAVPQIAVAFLGERVDMPERVRAPFTPENITIQADTERSKGGNILGSVIRHKRFTISPEWNGLTYSFVNDTYLPFWTTHASELKPFFWAHDIGTFPNEVYYVTLPRNGAFRRPLLFNNRVESLNLVMEGVLEE